MLFRRIGCGALTEATTCGGKVRLEGLIVKVAASRAALVTNVASPAVTQTRRVTLPLMPDCLFCLESACALSSSSRSQTNL